MSQHIGSATPADMVNDAREELGEALNRMDIARLQFAAGEAPDLGAVITHLERAEQQLDEVAEALS